MQKEQSKLLKSGCSICYQKDRFWFIPLVSVYKKNPVGYMCSKCGSTFDKDVELLEISFLNHSVIGVS